MDLNANANAGEENEGTPSYSEMPPHLKALYLFVAQIEYNVSIFLC